MNRAFYAEIAITAFAFLY